MYTSTDDIRHIGHIHLSTIDVYEFCLEMLFLPVDMLFGNVISLLHITLKNTSHLLLAMCWTCFHHNCHLSFQDVTI